MSELQKRILSGLLMVVGLWAAVHFGGWFFVILVVAGALLAFREWMTLVAKKPSVVWSVAGIYIAFAAIAAIDLRMRAGEVVVLWLIAVTVVTDIGAMWAGRTLGQQFPMRLAPTISPKKTVVGLIGGMVAAALVGAMFMPLGGSEWTVLLSAVLAILAQLGDLFESILKRRVGVKDSGAIIPGHGGILDRIDGHLFVLPVGWMLWLLGILPF